MTSFDRELQAQKDIAAIEKQKLALLQVKKESYINYLKNKGNTPWIPGGDGAKHATSLHKSVNREAVEQRQLKQAWCRSPWPGALPQTNKQTTPGRSRPGEGGRPYDIPSQSQAQAQSQDFYAFSPDRPSAQAAQRPLRAATSPQRLPSGTRERADSDMLSVFSSAAPSVASSHRSRITTSGTGLGPVSGAGAAGAAAPAGSNSKYVALTVRLINTAHPAQKSSYGVFIVPRGCSRLEMIAHIERQFGVQNQVSDISITYRSGYSHSVTVKSLSMGTIADVPDVNDYSSITIYLGGSTVFDSAGNIVTKSASGEVLSSKTATFTGAETPSQQQQLQQYQYQQQSRQMQRTPSSGAMYRGGEATPASVPGLDAGDTLNYFDGVDVVSVDDDDTNFSDTSSVAPSASATATQSSANLNHAGAGPQPEKVPLYESLHPSQRQHNFSFASPAKPLLTERGAAGVLGSPKNSYYSPVALADAQQQQPQVVQRSPYEIQSYLLDAEPEAAHRRLPSSDGADEEGAEMGGTSGSRYHGESLKRSILTKKSSVRDKSSSMAAPFQGSSANLYMYEEATPGAFSRGSEEEKGQHTSRPPLQGFYSSEQAQTRLPRDWLAEAEAQVQREQRAGVGAGAGTGAGTAHRTSNPSSVASSRHSQQPPRLDDLGSPAYRANTVSSQSRVRERPAAPQVRGRSRSRSRSELDQQRSSSAGRVRARSHSADATSRHQQQWRPLPMPVSPAPVIRTTAASRGRNAFINHRATDYVAVRDTSRGRARSNSAGTTRSLADARRYHSFSHTELPPMDDFHQQGYDEGDVWLSDPSSGHHHHDAYNAGPYQQHDGYGGGRDGQMEEWRGDPRDPHEQQRVRDYQALYAEQEHQHPGAYYPRDRGDRDRGEREREPPRINEGPQQGGAGDSMLSMNMNMSVEAEDLTLPWSHRPEQDRGHQQQQHQLQQRHHSGQQWAEGGGNYGDESHPEHHQQQQQQHHDGGGGDGDGGFAQQGGMSRRGSNRSATSGKHFAMNLDELLAEMA